ncbi:hypothetical protein TREES_T100012285 [Tupaia chinensis]|uniref:Uncharacterized protein n=1 Tax=Tupaia chinensis TaxID=246437 RepID=L9JG46_TUPCH|nr:hypothetical protein TREES_T100012285 [Tupaia chinensis]
MSVLCNWDGRLWSSTGYTASTNDAPEAKTPQPKQSQRRAELAPRGLMPAGLQRHSAPALSPTLATHPKATQRQFRNFTLNIKPQRHNNI